MLRYEFRTGVTKQKRSRKLWVMLPFVLLLGGGYLVVNAYSPSMRFPTDGPQDVTAKKLTDTKPNLAQNRLYLPQINIDLPIGDEASEGGALHRLDAGGDPSAGGNYVLGAARFSLGITPIQTREKSPFYHIGQLSVGDQVYVDYDGVRYAYEVTKKSVAQGDGAIDASGGTSRLTLYSYESDISNVHDVIEAKPIGTIAWVNGIAKLKTSEENNF